MSYLGVYLFFLLSAKKLHFFLGVFYILSSALTVTRLTELTPEIVHEFIEKIVVPKPDKVDGKRHQRVYIHCNTISLWAAPEPETLERDYLAYYQAMQKRKKKAA